MIIALSQVGEPKNTTPARRRLFIRKIVRAKSDGADIVYCVADGANLAYSFEFFVAEKSILRTQPSRLNSHHLPPVDTGTPIKCRVTVTSYADGSTTHVTREITT